MSDFCCISCDQKFEEHYTLYETEKERQMAGKPVREEYYPLASNPEIQKETFKKLGLDTRSYEERLIEELKEEEKQGQVVQQQHSSLGIPLKQGQTELIMNPGAGNHIPQVSVIIDTNKNYNPKQDPTKRPEKSIRIMQERGIAGQGNRLKK